MNFQRLSCDAARELLRESSGRVQIVDVRDEESYLRGHIRSAVHLDNSTLPGFLEQADLEAPVLVYCYHGHMSQSAAAYLAERGFSRAYSLDGGYAAWSMEEAGQDMGAGKTDNQSDNQL